MLAMSKQKAAEEAERHLLPDGVYPSARPPAALRQTDQAWQHAFWAHAVPHTVAQGLCLDVAWPASPRVADADAGRRWLDLPPEALCILPERFNFPVTFPALSSRGEATYEPPVVLHWPGPRRKPWLHWHAWARTAFDDVWWGYYEDLVCAGEPCVLSCET